ncbi:MAG: phosphodiester glycosidase family protein [Lachnospiraceae bacterium]|nr:phosphodiester glycosidase family protein [Lachnospiraceae bacterium]
MRKTIKILLVSAGLFIAATPVISIADDEIMDEGIVGIEEDSDVSEEESALGLSDKNSDETYDDLSGLIEVISETQVHEGLTMEDIIEPSPQMQVPAEAPSSILNVTTIAPSPGPEWAAEKYAEEYENAELKYRSDTLFYTCARKETENGGIYFLTHIVIKNANQINGSDSFGDFGGARETPLDAAKRCGAKILTNGSYFDYGTGYAYGGSLLIRNNKVVHGEYADSYEICLRKDGTLFSPRYNTVDAVLNQNVVFSWGTCEDLLIKDFEKCTLTDYDWNGHTYPRCAIGMVRPLEYYIITAGEAGYQHGITIYEEQEIFSDLGCAYARGLDGGGSSALVIDGKYVNENGDRTGDGSFERRAVADFLIITE